MLLTAAFWRNAAVRAVKTAAQTAVALLGADAFNVLTVDWASVGSVSAGAAILSLLMSIGQADEVAPKADRPMTDPMDHVGPAGPSFPV